MKAQELVKLINVNTDIYKSYKYNVINSQNVLFIIIILYYYYS